MPNPILPSWECVPDGEPRLFGDRVYLYGSHDRVGNAKFCDYKLKVWSAPVSDLNHWTCHGTSFQTRPTRNHPADTPHTDNELYAPDVVEKDGKYWLFPYTVNSRCSLGVSDHPEGPFKWVGLMDGADEDTVDDKIFLDPGVLVDDDGQVYCFHGFCRSYMCKLDPNDMTKVVPGSLIRHIIRDWDGVPDEERFFEASSIRKINGKYYFVYSPCHCSRLAYAIADKPEGPYEFKGYLVDNGVDYPGGNDHGSLCCVNGQWYIFYHRMTNTNHMSRKACVEKIYFNEDGTINPVEMTSLGFQDSLNPYEITLADWACVLKGGCYITEIDAMTRVITNIRLGAVVGYKYFDFGMDYGTKLMTLALKMRGRGSETTVNVHIDSEDGEIIGTGVTGMGDGVCKIECKAVTGRHAVYFTFDTKVQDDEWRRSLKNHELLDIVSFCFMK